MEHQTYNASGEIALKGQKPFRYIPSNDLKEAVNLTLLLGNRPLLLTGEPGVGKTQLAKAIAHEWYPEDTRQHFFEWNIKSTSRAQDGLYIYDALRHLRDAQAKEELKSTELGADDGYFKLGPLAKAIKASKVGSRSILLIDEIDKADIDFPNDLLHELEQYEFTISETGEKFERPKGDFVPPLIIITSNRERELPSAFLRRCLYYHIPFPGEEELERIISAHFGSGVLLNGVVKAFLRIQTEIKKRLPATDKNVGTSELIDWCKIVDNLNEKKEKTADESRLLIEARAWMSSAKDNHMNIPFYQVLLKNMETLNLFKNLSNSKNG